MIRKIVPTRWISWPALVFALAVLGCGPDEPTLRPIPEPDVQAADAGVKRQLAEKKAQLDQLLAQADAGAAERARSFADLGLIYLTYDFLDAAEVCFDNARTLEPESFRWAYLQAYLSQARGQIPPAVELYEQVLRLEADYLPALVRLGRAQLDLGRAELARARFASALQLDESSAPALEGLGKVAEAGGDLAAAASYFERALEQQPEASSLHYALGQVYRRLGELDRAREHLAASGDVAVRLEDPLINPIGELAESAQFYVMRAGEAMEAEDYPTAAAAYREALARDPTDFKSYKGLSYSLEKLGDLDGAMSELRRALEQGTTGDPERDRVDRGEVHRVLGSLQVLNGRDAAAVSSFEQALALVPGDENARLKLANVLARLGRFTEAVEHYDQLLAERPDLAQQVLVKRATALVNLGREDDARGDFERAIAADPENPEPRLRYAEALEHFGDTAGAAVERRRATELMEAGHRAAQTLAEEGMRLSRQGDFEGALANYRRALEAAPDANAVRFQLAAVLGHLGRCGEALEAFRQVIESEPRHQAARRGEIACLILSERYGEARVRLNEAMQLFPRDAQLAHTQARMMATVPDARVRDGRLALAVAQKLHEVLKEDPRIRETLAMALAEAGQLEAAVTVQRELIREAGSRSWSALLPAFEAELAAYEAGRPWTFAEPEELISATLQTAPPR